jgi:hypothetical protein
MNSTEQAGPCGSPLTEELGAWVPTADTARLPPFDVPVWVYEDGYCYIACRADDSDGWLWAKCYTLPYLDKAGRWQTVDAEIDDEYLPTLWQPLPEPPRYNQAALDAAKLEAAAMFADLRVE